MGLILHDGPVGGPLTVAFLTLVLVAAFEVLTLILFGAYDGPLHLRHVAAAFGRRVDRARSPEQPAYPPIESVAGNARRLRAELLTLAPGTPMARRLGTTRAYDDLLANACLALDVPDTLSALGPGKERDIERLRVEHALEKAGLRLSA